MQRPVAAVPLKPIAGQHDGYFAIRPRTSLDDDEEEGHWTSQFVSVFKSFERITDDAIDRHLGAQRQMRPSIRNRVKKLIEGGFYEAKSIKLRRMEAKEDGMPCVLACIN